MHVNQGQIKRVRAYNSVCGLMCQGLYYIYNMVLPELVTVYVHIRCSYSGISTQLHKQMYSDDKESVESVQLILLNTAVLV